MQLALARVEGSFEADAGSGWEALTLGANDTWTWPAGTTLRAKGGPGRLTLTDGTRVEVERGARVAVHAQSPPTLTLARGEVYCAVPVPAAAPGDVRFVVRTAHGEAQVTGTEFGVALQSGRTQVAVQSGAVRCRTDAGQVEVGAGFATRLRAGRPPSDPRATDVDRAFAWRRALRPAEERIFLYDFEAEPAPAEWDQGRRVAGPPRGANRGALETADAAPFGVAIHLAIPPAQQVSPHPRLLRFRYYLEADAQSWIQLQIKDQDHGDNCKVRLRNLERGRWGLLEVPLDQLCVFVGGDPDPSRPIRPGDRLAFLQLLVVDGGAGARAVFDDVELAAQAGR